MANQQKKQNTAFFLANYLVISKKSITFAVEFVVNRQTITNDDEIQQ